MTDQIDKLRTLNGELCAEINRQEKRIRELESLVRDMWRELQRIDIGGDLPENHDEYGERIAALGMEVDR